MADSESVFILMISHMTYDKKYPRETKVLLEIHLKYSDYI